MRIYFLSKLSSINHQMAFHEGDLHNRSRLAIDDYLSDLLAGMANRCRK
jgi:hypothetical protein